MNRRRSQYTRVYACPHCGARYSVEIASQIKGIVALLAAGLGTGVTVISSGVRSRVVLALVLAAVIGVGYMLWWDRWATLREPYE